MIEILADHFGYDVPEEMHDALKMHFLVTNRGGLPTLTSTTRMTTMEFEEYLDKVRRWAASEYGVQIPLPNEVIDTLNGDINIPDGL